MHSGLSHLEEEVLPARRQELFIGRKAEDVHLFSVTLQCQQWAPRLEIPHNDRCPEAFSVRRPRLPGRDEGASGRHRQGGNLWT